MHDYGCKHHQGICKKLAQGVGGVITGVAAMRLARLMREHKPETGAAVPNAAYSDSAARTRTRRRTTAGTPTESTET